MVAIAVLTPSLVSAQTANDYYNQFATQAQSGNNATMYGTLYKAYDANIKQLQSSAAGTPQYTEAHDNLIKMWPYLEKAAFFYSGNRQDSNALLMAQAYLEMPAMPQFRDVNFTYSANRAQLAYYAAYKYFNGREYGKAKPFLKEYIKTGEEKNRKNVYVCLIEACNKTGDTEGAQAALQEASRFYPEDWNIVSMGVNSCLENKDYRNLQAYLDKAKALRPNDDNVLNIQGMLYEETQQYDRAADLYASMLSKRPNSLDVHKHLSLNYYNAGVKCLNAAATESNGQSKKRLLNDGEQYMRKATPMLEKVVAAEPSAQKYNIALAVAYGQLGQTAKLDTQNNKLASMGLSRVSKNDMLQTVAYAGNTGSSASSATVSSAASVNPQQSSAGSIASAATASTAGGAASAGTVPKFSEFAKGYIEERINQWQAKDPYETAEEYRQRVTAATRDAKVDELKKAAEQEYIAAYGGTLNVNSFKLQPYDAENEAFLINSDYGQLVLPVPRSNNEARQFESNWVGVSVRSPKYFIADDGLALAEVTFVTPSGRSYQYNNSESLTYTQTSVDVKFNDIDYSDLAQNTPHATTPQVQRQEVSVGLSDVDVNIPVSKKSNENTFALIISNENYSMVTKVPSANNDGARFKEYCQKTLGLPEQNITYLSDASYGVMLSGMRHLSDIAEAFKNEPFNVLFYYAGHGIPNESNKDAYLLPTDANGQQTEVCYSLNKLYSELGGLGAKSVVVFLDACFSGAERDGGMLASARGIAIKPKETAPQGNMVVFSAATGDETAYPYKEKNHGLFTYYLLKKLQETEGNVTLKDLGDYITSNVHKQSVLINHKSQTPTVKAAFNMSDDWGKMKLK